MPRDQSYLNYESCLEGSGYVNCNYDFVGKMFTKFYQEIEKANISPLRPVDYEWYMKGVIKSFAQNEFGDVGVFGRSPLNKNGYVFYPNACVEKQCNLHIAFHACEEGLIGG